MNREIVSKKFLPLIISFAVMITGMFSVMLVNTSDVSAAIAPKTVVKNITKPKTIKSGYLYVNNKPVIKFKTGEWTRNEKKYRFYVKSGSKWKECTYATYFKKRPVSQRKTVLVSNRNFPMRKTNYYKTAATAPYVKSGFYISTYSGFNKQYGWSASAEGGYLEFAKIHQSKSCTFYGSNNGWARINLRGPNGKVIKQGPITKVI